MNKYTDELNKIKAGESFEAKTIELLISAPNKKNKRIKITAISAVAACLAVIIGLTALWIPTGGSKNTFSLTAYAAEATGDEAKGKNLNNKSYVKIGAVKDFGSTTAFIVGRVNDKKEATEDYPPSGSTICSANHTFVFNLNCKGDNIDTVTFDSGNGKFRISTFCDNVFNTKGKSDNYNGFSGDHEFYCDSFTTKYKEQIWNTEPIFDPVLKGNQAEDKIYPRLCLETEFKNFEKNSEPPKAVKEFYDWYGDGSSVKEISNAEKKALYEAYMDYFVRDLTVTATVKFNDGSVESKKIKFKTEFLAEDSNGAQFNLKAKIV